jgi:hypothetical protein
MVMRPEVQPEGDSTSEQSDCILRVTEAEFIRMINSLILAAQKQTSGGV